MPLRNNGNHDSALKERHSSVRGEDEKSLGQRQVIKTKG